VTGLLARPLTSSTPAATAPSTVIDRIRHGLAWPVTPRRGGGGRDGSDKLRRAAVVAI